MSNTQKINFSLKHFESSADKDFNKAVMIYNTAIPVDTKTNTNEIMHFADHCGLQKNREMYFFGLYVDNVVMGFVSAGYLKISKTIIIDYIVLKAEYHLNSVFYPLFSLLQRFFAEAMIDYDYIITEVSTKSIEDSVDSESFFSRKMLQMEDFRIADALYMQPKLGIQNEESSFQFHLLIKSSQPLASLKVKTYLFIVKDIYYEHYKAWYQAVDEEHSEEYEKHIGELYQSIKDTLENRTEISLGIQGSFCEYYKASDCHYANSTAGFVPAHKSQNRPWLLLGIPISTAAAFGMTFLAVKVLEKYQITSDFFAPIFAAIVVICTSVFSIAFSRINIR